MTAVKPRWIVYALALAATLAAATLAGGGQNGEPAVASARALQPEARAAQTAMTSTSVIGTDQLAHRALAGSGENPFSTRSWEPPIPPAAVRSLPHAPPQAPPPPFSYRGKLTREGVIIAVLTSQNRDYIVQAGETLDGVYAIEAIDDARVVLKYLALGTRQILSFGAPGAPVSDTQLSAAPMGGVQAVAAMPTSGAPPRSAQPAPRFVGVPGPVLAPYHPDHDE